MEPSQQQGCSHRHRLWQYFLLTYAAMLVNAARYLPEAHYDGPLSYLFVGAAFLTYCALYLLPFLALVGLVDGLLFARPMRWALGRMGRSRVVLMYGLAWLGFSAAQVFVYVDVFVFRLWGYHLNSFVLNVLTTPGGVESMGMADSTKWSFAAAVAALVGVQGLLLVGVLKTRWLGRVVGWPLRGTSRRVALAGAFVLVAAFQVITYGASKLCWNTTVLQAAETLPFYLPITFSKLGRKFGWEQEHPDTSLRVRYESLTYPLKPLSRQGAGRPLNTVWLVCESWRADAVTPEVMPHTYEFATRDAVWFRRHYSAGDGTRMGIFSLFYGLHGSYWFPMLRANRPPVLMDVLRQAGYQFDCRTSQSFTYPEFERTVFAQVPSKDLHPISGGGPGWQRDRWNVTNMLNWLDKADKSRPFFQFMFFESAHSRYYFPPESAIRKPYLDDFNYADLEGIAASPERRRLLVNRYVNACYHLDSQIQRVLEGLRQRGLLDSTIVVLTGDHGEEFWEVGRWGHPADSFHEGHQMVPLVLHVPGEPARQVQRMTTHIDVPPTVLRRLGVTSPAGDYSLGFDLLDPNAPKRSSVSAFGWSDMAYATERHKITHRYRGPGFSPAKVTTRDDKPVGDAEAGRVLQQTLPQLLNVLREMKRFAGP